MIALTCFALFYFQRKYIIPLPSIKIEKVYSCGQEVPLSSVKVENVENYQYDAAVSTIKIEKISDGEFKVIVPPMKVQEVPDRELFKVPWLPIKREKVFDSYCSSVGSLFVQLF